jgi:type IV secretory pathway TrbL component
MLADTAFSFAHASPNQVIAFLGGAIAHIGFFAWIVYLVRSR